MLAIVKPQVLTEKYRANTGGNVAMMFSIAVPVFLSMIALAIDGTRLMTAQNKLSGVVDNAALAGAFVADSDSKNRNNVTQEYLDANAYMVLPAKMTSNAKIEFNDSAENLYVEATADVKLSFGRLFGKRTMPVRSSVLTSYAISEIEPVTLAFALDVSGSMDLQSSNNQLKIDVLKDATNLLFNAVEEGSKRPELLRDAIRTGMSAYNTELVSDQNMNWGWEHLKGGIDRLVADGGTNSTPALINSYNQIKDDRQFRKSNDPSFNQSTLREYVLFMTDGDNNMPNFDVESARVCYEMRQDGIEIYSVAFTAPDKGRVLLWNCASWNNPGEDSNPDAGPGNNGNGLDPSKCTNNGSKGKGKALGHCKGDPTPNDGTEKSKYYFDADDAETFKSAFVSIGNDISKSEIHIVR